MAKRETIEAGAEPIPVSPGDLEKVYEEAAEAVTAFKAKKAKLVAKRQAITDDILAMGEDYVEMVKAKNAAEKAYLRSLGRGVGGTAQVIPVGTAREKGKAAKAGA